MSVYFGEGAFGEQGLYESSRQVEAATAVAEFISPNVQGSSTTVVPVAEADASMPTPVVVVEIQVPVAQATADFLPAVAHGGTFRPDRPTFLELAPSATLALGPFTSLAVAGAPTALAFGDAATLGLQRGATIFLAPTSQSLELDQASTLALDDLEGALLIDG